MQRQNRKESLPRRARLPLRSPSTLVLGSRWPHFAFGGFDELRGIVQLPGFHHEVHVSGGTDVLERVAADDEEISQLPGFERAKFAGDIQCPRAVDGCDLQRGRRGDARQNECVQLAMRSEPRQEVTPLARKTSGFTVCSSIRPSPYRSM